MACWLAGPLAMVLAGCSPTGVALTMGAHVGIAASQERGLDEAARDTLIRARINEAWFEHDLGMYQAVKLQVHEGRVVVSGAVEDEAQRDAAVGLVWGVPGVREVIDEVVVRPDREFIDPWRDRWVATRIRSNLTLDAEVRAIDYDVEVVDGVVYLLGIARGREALERVLAHARNVPNVRRIVSHVRILEPPTALAPAASPVPTPVPTPGHTLAGRVAPLQMAAR